MVALKVVTLFPCVYKTKKHSSTIMRCRDSRINSKRNIYYVYSWLLKAHHFRQSSPFKTRYAFPCSSLGLGIFDHKSSWSTSSHWLEPKCPKFKLARKWMGPPWNPVLFHSLTLSLSHPITPSYSFLLPLSPLLTISLPSPHSRSPTTPSLSLSCEIALMTSSMAVRVWVGHFLIDVS